MDIIDYVLEDGIQLFPVQRFVLKVIYGLELDTKVPDETHRRIHFRYPLRLEDKHQTFSEAEYLQYLFGLDRVYGVTPAPWEIYLVSGRRSGKNILGQIILGYEALVSAGKQERYGLRPFSPITLQYITFGKDEAIQYNVEMQSPSFYRKHPPHPVRYSIDAQTRRERHHQVPEPEQ